MTYRGRLIFPFTADLRQIDTGAMAEDPDGPGPLTSGYDPDFREPIVIPEAGKQIGASARVEKDPLLLPCQVEPVNADALRQLFAGNVPNTSVILIFHFEDLESGGLVDPDGNAMIRIGDRLDGLYDQGGTKVQGFAYPPGVFVTEARPIGIGIGLHRNLLAVAFEDREQGVEGG